MLKIKDIISKLKSNEFVAFGSRALGVGSKYSDVDITITYDGYDKISPILEKNFTNNELKHLNIKNYFKVSPLDNNSFFNLSFIHKRNILRFSCFK